MARLDETNAPIAYSGMDPRKAPILFAMVALGIYTIVHLALPETLAVQLATVMLALIGGAYIGFAARVHDARSFWIEMSTALLFGVFAFLGLSVHWLFIPLGLFLHGLWDFLHHLRDFGAPVPQWYIPFCAIFDVAAAAVITLLFVL